MSSIDNRLVKMEFDNKQFLANVLSTIRGLDDLKKSLDMDTAAQEFNKLDKSAQNVKLSSIASAVEDIKNRFSTMGIVGMAALANLTNSAINVGKSLISNIVNPIVQGGINRAMNIENAHFMLQGLLGDEQQVQAIMDDAKNSVDGTAYSYDAAAKAAAQFAASGLRSGEQMMTALRGITGVAATTNSEYEDISRIFTTVAGNGRLMGDQLLQLSSRGLNAAAILGQQLGKSEAEIRDMVSKGEISFEMFASAMDSAFGTHAFKANETFNGAMANIKAALARIGAEFVSPLIVQNGPLVQMFNSIRLAVNAVKDEIGPFADAFVSAVTTIAEKVKWFLDNLDVKSIMQGVVNIFNALLSVLKPIGEAFLNVFPQPTVEQLQAGVDKFKALTEQMKLSDRTIENIKRTFQGLFAAIDIVMTIVGSIIRLFAGLVSALLPVGSGVLGVTGNIGDMIVAFDQAIKQSGFFDTAITAIVGTVKKIVDGIKSFVSKLRELFTTLGGGKSDVDQAKESFEKMGESLNPVAAIGEKVKAVIAKIKEGFASLSPIFEKAAQAIGKAASKVKEAIKSMFVTDGSIDFQKIIDTINGFLIGGVLAAIISFVNKAKSAVDQVGGIADAIASAITKIADAFGGGGGDKGGSSIDAKQVLTFAAAIGILAASLYVLAGIDSEDLALALVAVSAVLGEVVGFMKIISIALKTVNPAQIIKISAAMVPLSLALLMLASAVKKLGSLSWEELAKGLLGVASMMAVVAGTAKFMNGATKGFGKVAATLILFAAGLNVLVLAVKQLGSMGVKELIKGLGSVTLLMAEIAAFVAVIGKINTSGIVKVSGSMILIGTALNILAAAVKSLGGSDVKSLIKGLGSVGTLLTELIIFFALFSKVDTSGILKASTAMVIIGAAMNVLAAAVKSLGSLDVKSLVKGLGSVGIALTEILVFFKLLDKVNGAGLLKASTSMVIVGAALNVLAEAVRSFGSLSVKELAKGLGAMAVALGEIVIAMKLMPSGIMLQSLALVALGVALNEIGSVVAKLSGLSWEEVAKGLVAMAGALAILAVAMKAMQGSLAGAAAMTVAAAAILILTPALMMLGNLSLLQIAGALIALAGSFAVMGVAGAVLRPLVPTILALAASMALFGAACLAIGVGIAAAVAALALLAMNIGSVVQAATALFEGLAALIPTIVNIIKQTLVGLATMIIETAPLIVQAVTVMLSQMLQAAVTLIPQFVDVIKAALMSILQLIIDIAPQVGEAITALLTMLIQVGISLIPQFVELFREAFTAILQLVIEMAPQIGEAITALIQMLLNVIMTNLPSIVEAGISIIMSVLNGIREHIGEIVTIAVQIVTNFISGIASNMGSIIQSAFDLIISFINGLADGIRNNAGAITDACWNLVSAIIEAIAGFAGDIAQAGADLLMGFVGGIGDAIGGAIDTVTGFFGGIVDGVCDFLGIHSPSTLFMGFGDNTVQGYIDGMSNRAGDANQAGIDIAQSTVDGVTSLEMDANNAGQGLGTQAATGVGVNVADFQLAGSGAGQSFVTGINNTAGEAQAAGQNVGQQAFNGINSNTANMQPLGQQMGQGFANGLKNTASQAQSAGQSIGQKAVNGIKSNQSSMQPLGRTMGAQFVSGLQNTASQAQAAGRTVGQQALNGIRSNQSQFQPLGRTFGAAFAQGLSGTQSQARSAGQSVGQAAITGLRSVSNNCQTIGKQYGSSFISGLNSVQSQARSAGKAIAESAKNGMAEVSARSTGENFAKGFADGITSQTWYIKDKAKAAARAAKEAANAELGVNSPSRVMMETGKYVAMGLGLGIQKFIPYIENKSANAAETIIESVSDILKDTSKLFDEETFNPVITPEVDLSNVLSSQSDLARIFDDINGVIGSGGAAINAQQIASSQKLSGKRAKEFESGDRNVGSQIVQNFTQNNYSPKALDRLTIYRQSKTLFAQVKGPVNVNA